MSTDDKASPVQGDVIRRCSDCRWVHKFTPRQDEIEKGLLLGCKFPGWEGYTNDTVAMLCKTFEPYNGLREPHAGNETTENTK